MELKYTLEILTKDIQDIEKLVGNLQNSPEGSALEMDLALSKLRNVYEILTMIREDRVQLHRSPAPPPENAPIPQPSGAGSGEGDKATAMKEKPEAVTAGSVAGKETAILAEKFSTESSINENMANRRGNDMDSRLKGQPIQSISRSIGINDRFFLIRELFNGDTTGCRTFLEQLDGAAGLEEASGVIGQRFAGQMEHEGVTLLLHLVRRRFQK